jgi:uncharacterized protein
MSRRVYDAINSQLLNLLSTSQVKFVKLRIAGGEPLLVFDKWKEPIGRFLEKARKKGSAELLTNLVELPEGFVDYAKRYDNLGINVSLDSLTISKPFANGKSSADCVLKNINEIKKYKNIFIMTVLTDNGKYLPDLAEYIIKNKFKWEIQLNKFYEPNLHKKTVINNLKKVIDIFNSHGVSISEYLMFNFCDFHSNKSCEAGRKMFYINPVGDIYNCQMQEKGKPLTNIAHNDLIERLNNNTIKKPYSALCTNCSVCDFCHGDCPINNGPARREYFCDVMKNFFLYAAKNVLKFSEVSGGQNEKNRRFTR